MAKKTTDAEIAKRIQDVYQAIVQGLSRSEIHAYCAQRWKLSQRTADKYYSAAYEIMTRDGKAEIDQMRAEQIARLRKILRRLAPGLTHRSYVKDEKGNQVVDEVTGLPKMIEVPNDTVMRHYLITLRHLSRITGIETIRIDDPGSKSIEELKALFADLHGKINGLTED